MEEREGEREQLARATGLLNLREESLPYFLPLGGALSQPVCETDGHVGPGGQTTASCTPQLSVVLDVVVIVVVVLVVVLSEHRSEGEDTQAATGVVQDGRRAEAGRRKGGRQTCCKM